ncbi:hypothetical protein M405DRAFT_836176 [Rhizopogon salebrosus TDB-379]|nr:hypothetical protein M405DRAFT_836176 [Rhizopogon salebrosus TDB-379]
MAFKLPMLPLAMIAPVTLHGQHHNSPLSRIAIQFVGCGGRAAGLQGLEHTTPLQYFSTIPSLAQRPSSVFQELDVSLPKARTVLLVDERRRRRKGVTYVLVGEGREIGWLVGWAEVGCGDVVR